LNHAPGDAINLQRPIAADEYPDFASAFRGMADMAGPAAGFAAVDMTQLGH